MKRKMAVAAALLVALFLFTAADAWASASGEAYAPVDGEDFRLTLDENIRWRTDHVDLGTNCFGTSLLDPDQVLMELKTPGGIPLWMVRFLSDNDIRKVSFSKYGTAYRQMLDAEKTMGGRRYA